MPPLPGRSSPLYGRITCPVLIPWGQEDNWIPIAKGRALQALIPHTHFHAIPDAGHLVIEEQPRQLIEKISPFLRATAPAWIHQRRRIRRRHPPCGSDSARRK
jgi:pimeloyl-ACP methyl ester carboxylesterase